jgi:lipopolysaccharide/colanic/teichoic acid biosynthesis glycosyltransferase
LRYADHGKRAFDVIGAAVALLLLAPVMLAVAVLVGLRLGRPIIFRQLRPGRRGELFTIYKFRTMLDTPDGSDEMRLTPLGRFLRAASLDELPELWNVLTGDMSLVGPRPLLPQYLARYTQEQRRRHDVRPGITGLAQVRGRNALTWERKFELDVCYVDSVSLLTDVKILLLTFGSVVARRGITQPGHATAQEFMGTPVQ